jgi:hypothetical protein
MSATVHLIHRPQSPDTHTVSEARVTGKADQHFLLDHPECPAAGVAFSCLLQPCVGDTVLISQPDHGQQGFILAILRRPDASQGELQLPGDTRVTLGSQGMRVQSNKVQLEGRESLDLTAPALNLTAVTSSVKVKHWQSWFDTVESCAVNVQLTAKTVSCTVGRLIQRLVESFRKTDGLDETRAGRMRVHVEGHHQTHAQHLTSTAQGFVKIDGQKIDLG